MVLGLHEGSVRREAKDLSHDSLCCSDQPLGGRSDVRGVDKGAERELRNIRHGDGNYAGERKCHGAVGSGATFVTRTFSQGSTTFSASNATFGDPTPGVAKELNVQGTDISMFKVDGSQLTNPKPTVVNLVVTPSLITATIGSVVQTKATCTYSDGTSIDCTAEAAFTHIKGGVAAYTGAGAIIGAQAGPAKVDVSTGSVTVKLSVLIVDLLISFNGALMLAPN